MFGHFANDRRELAGGHMGAIILVNIPELHENLRPGFRVGAAVERGELAGFDLGHMIATLHRPTVVVEHQWQILRCRQRFEKQTKVDIGALNFRVVDRIHLR